MHVLIVATLLALITSSAQSQFWQSSDGPPAASTCMVTNSKGHVIVGTPFSKIYRSTDRGTSWQSFDEGIDDGGTNFFPFNQISVSANDHLYAAINGLGVYKSTNDGVSWTKIDFGIPVSPNSRITVDTKTPPGEQTQVFIGLDAGSSKIRAQFSSDGGATFIPIPLTGLPSATSALFEVFLSPNSNKMFVSVSYNKGLFRTTDRGASWRRIDNGDGNSNESDDLYKTMTSDVNGNLYVGRNALPGSSKITNAVVLKSTNDGEQWSYLLTGWDTRTITNNRISAISFAPNGDMWVTTEKNSGPFKGTNYGSSFAVVTDGLIGDGSSSGIVVTKDNHVFVAPIGDPVYRHLDPTSVDEETLPRIIRTDVAPNPANERVGVSFFMEETTPVIVDLINVAGERVIEGHQMSAAAGMENKVWLSTSLLPQGVYTLRVVSRGSVTTKNVVIAR
ncbi:MAG: T9SS type A sorting domain-containing protein [Candidatus Kapabacteria bacterium]|nr:T9SS type A sorting domain-containing protein [Candidatus Kapabacteria bacterium]